MRVKKLDLSTSGVRVVVLNDEDASKLNLYGLDRVKIKKRNRCVIAILDISDGMVKKGEVGCFKEVSDSLNLKKGGNRPPSIS